MIETIVGIAAFAVCLPLLIVGALRDALPPTWEVFDWRDGRPVRVYRTRAAARRACRRGRFLDYERVGAGWLDTTTGATITGERAA